MKDHNKEIRNLTEAVNNLNEQGGWPGGFQHIPDILRGLIERYYFLKWIEENPDDPYVKLLKLWCQGDEQCMYELWIKAGKPRPEEPEEEDITPEDDDDDKPSQPFDPPGPGGGRYPSYSPQLP
tara:strand:+ start:1192 stop:1563 length:372 start_codon:yes stop_codon:yes gene_type:complete